MRTALMPRCPDAPGANVRDSWIGIGIILGGTLLLTLAWMALKRAGGRSPVIDSLGIVPFPAALLLSLPFTFYKESSSAAKASIVVVGLAFLLVLSLIVAQVTSRL